MRKRYFVSLLTDYGELNRYSETDSPLTAINKWMNYNLERPTMANISCGSIEDCMELYKAFLSNAKELHQKYWVEKSMPYRYDYIYATCLAYCRGESKVHFLGKRDFYDSVHPFCYG